MVRSRKRRSWRALEQWLKMFKRDLVEKEKSAPLTPHQGGSQEKNKKTGRKKTYKLTV